MLIKLSIEKRLLKLSQKNNGRFWPKINLTNKVLLRKNMSNGLNLSIANLAKNQNSKSLRKRKDPKKKHRKRHWILKVFQRSNKIKFKDKSKIREICKAKSNSSKNNNNKISFSLRFKQFCHNTRENFLNTNWQDTTTFGFWNPQVCPEVEELHVTTIWWKLAIMWNAKNLNGLLRNILRILWWFWRGSLI